MRMYNQEIARYFGFEHVSILFHDSEQDQLYTITFGDEDELKYELDQKRKYAKNAEEVSFINAFEAMKDMELSKHHMIFFPISTGITSQVFKTQKTVIVNDFDKYGGKGIFVNEIDNFESLKGIKNMMFCATTRDDGTSNGVVQLFNMNNPIQKKDKKRLDAIANFFGANIQKIEDITKKLTTKLAVKFECGSPDDAIEGSDR